MKTEPNWRPRRNGDRYCSSACGHGCTWPQYQAARRAGATLAKHLGKGWKFRVWENFGWHYAAETIDGTMRVHENRSIRDGLLISYTAYFQRDTTAIREVSSDRGVLTGGWAERGNTAREAVAAVLRVARAEIATIEAAIDSYEKAVRP